MDSGLPMGKPFGRLGLPGKWVISPTHKRDILRL